MGAWRFGPFDNDDAADFLDSMESTRDCRALIHRALRRAAKSRSYLELPQSARAWAAASDIGSTR